MAKHNFNDIAQRLMTEIGSYARMTRLCHELQRSLNDGYWQKLKRQERKKGFCKIAAHLVLLLEEKTGRKVTRYEMRPDIFLTIKQQKKHGVFDRDGKSLEMVRIKRKIQQKC